ncbi:MAG: hypothetical protein EOO75_11700, partial [Myxococcales bacterium]
MLRAEAETSTGVRLGGHGLHSGRPAAVMLRRAPGPLAFLWPHRDPVERSQLTVVRADMGVQVAAPTGERLDLVEHLLAPATRRPGERPAARTWRRARRPRPAGARPGRAARPWGRPPARPCRPARP